MVELKGDVDPAVEMWNSLFTDVANRHVPIKKTRIKGAKTPWMTSDPREGDSAYERGGHAYLT